MAVNMDSELLLNFIGYFPDDLSALPRTPLRFFVFVFLDNVCRNSCKHLQMPHDRSVFVHQHCKEGGGRDGVGFEPCLDQTQRDQDCR